MEIENFMIIGTQIISPSVREISKVTALLTVVDFPSCDFHCIRLFIQMFTALLLLQLPEIMSIKYIVL
jgi:hypothetical protein